MDTPHLMDQPERSVDWIKAAQKDFQAFPSAVRDRVNTALTMVAQGAKSDIAKPLKGVGTGVMQIAVRYRTNAWRVVYVAEVAGSLWVLHAFQKKSKTGVRTPKAEMDLVKQRLRRLREELSK